MLERREKNIRNLGDSQTGKKNTLRQFTRTHNERQNEIEAGQNITKRQTDGLYDLKKKD